MATARANPRCGYECGDHRASRLRHLYRRTEALHNNSFTQVSLHPMILHIIRHIISIIGSSILNMQKKNWKRGHDVTAPHGWPLTQKESAPVLRRDHNPGRREGAAVAPIWRGNFIKPHTSRASVIDTDTREGNETRITWHAFRNPRLSSSKSMTERFIRVSPCPHPSLALHHTSIRWSRSC